MSKMRISKLISDLSVVSFSVRFPSNKLRLRYQKGLVLAFACAFAFSSELRIRHEAPALVTSRVSQASEQNQLASLLRSISVEGQLITPAQCDLVRTSGDCETYEASMGCTALICTTCSNWDSAQCTTTSERICDMT